MDGNSPYDDWSKHIHAVITILKPYFNDWRSYASLVSVMLGIGVLVLESQVLLRMRMGHWEILGYMIWCIISFFLGPVFDIVAMVVIFLYCRHKSDRLHLTNESIAKALLPAPVVRSYRIMGGVCIIATTLTLISNILYMLRGWKEPPSQFFDWSSDAVRWLTSQIWYAIGMIILFHVVTRPAQSGVVIFGKFPRDLWAYKWYLCILYIPVHYMLTELCDVHRDTKEILVPLEILVDVLLYNGPFLIALLRLLYWAWKVAYDEAVLTGGIFEDEDVESSNSGDLTGRQRRGGSRGGDYVGLAMVDMDEGQGVSSQGPKLSSSSNDSKDSTDNPSGGIYVLEDDEAQAPVSVLKKSSNSPDKSPNLAKKSVKKSVMFDVDTEEDRTGADTHELTQDGRQERDVTEDEEEDEGQGQEHTPLV